LQDASISPSQFVKCRSQDFIRAGDRVKALDDLIYGQGDDQGFFVKKGSLGNLLIGNKSVAWDGRSGLLKNAGVESGDFAKCQSHEILQKGDTVKAIADLNFEHGDEQGKMIKAGALGTLLAGLKAVSWAGRSGVLRNTSVESHHFAKCKSCEYQADGDTVKAIIDLTYTIKEGQNEDVELVKAGSLGTLLNGHKCVAWHGRSGRLQNAGVEKNHYVKCKSEEFTQKGDVVKALTDLTYSQGDSEGAVVKKGSFGILIK